MYKKILVPVDGSEASKRGLAEAARLAKSLHAAIRLVHVVSDFVPPADYSPDRIHEGVIETMRKAGRQTLQGAEAFVADDPRG